MILRIASHRPHPTRWYHAYGAHRPDDSHHSVGGSENGSCSHHVTKHDLFSPRLHVPSVVLGIISHHPHPVSQLRPRCTSRRSDAAPKDGLVGFLAHSKAWPRHSISFCLTH